MIFIPRQVDDLHFQLEELNVISGDQLEKVAMRDDDELEELKKELENEQEKNATLQGMRKKKKRKKIGDAGDRSPGLPHAKRTLYR